MSKQETPSQQRISKNTGRLLLGLGVFFDLLPVLLLLVAFVLTAYLVGGSSKDVQDLAKSVEVYKSETYGNGSNKFWFDKIFDKAGAILVGATAGTKLAGGVVAGGAVVFFLGPIIYTAGSFLSTILAYIIFTVLFFVKGVNIWSFSSTQRVLVNMGSVVVENLPLVNLLPGITFMVWRHIKISQAEDRVKEYEFSRKISKVLNKKLAYA